MASIQERLAELRAKQRQQRLSELRSKAQQSTVAPPAPIEIPESPDIIAKNQATADLIKSVDAKLQRSSEVVSQIKTVQDAVTNAPEVYHPPQKSLQDLPKPTPTTVVTAKPVPIKESSQKLIEFAREFDKKTKGPVAIVDQQVRAREVLDLFDGDENALRAKIQELRMPKKRSEAMFTDIINKSKGVKPGAKVSEGGPLSVLEGLTQAVVRSGGGDLDINESRKIASKAGQMTGDVVQIASSIGSTVSLGKTLAKSSSKIVSRIGGILANPDTNPIPDAVYAAVTEGDYTENFLKGYAINLALGRVIGGKGALKAFKELPEGERKVLKNFLDEYKKSVDAGDIPKVLESKINPNVARELGLGNRVDIIPAPKVAKKAAEIDARPKPEPVKFDDPVQTELFDTVQKKPRVDIDDLTQEVPKQKFVKQTKDDTFDLLPGYERARTAVRSLNKPTLNSVRNSFVRNTIDVAGNLKRELRKRGEPGQKVIDKMEQALGASSKSKLRYEEAVEDVFGPIKSLKQKKLVSDYIDHRRTTFLADNKKAIGDRKGLTPEETTAYFNKIEKENPEVFKSVKAASDRYFGQMDKLLKDRLDAGLINKATYDELKDNIYSPRVWIQHLESTDGNVSQRLGEAHSGLKALKEGSDTELVHDLEFLMAKSITNAERQIASNNAGRELYDLMKTGEVSDMLVELKPLYGKNKQIKGYTKPPRGYEPVNVMIDGKPVQFGMEKEMADEFILRDPLLGPKVARWLRIGSGNNILKFNATQASTDFPLANVFRDVGTIMFANKEYSNFIPLASAQLGKDAGTVLKDAVLRKGRYLDYINEGGGMDFLMATADTWGATAKSKWTAPIRGAFEALRYVGETSEAITRLALRERAAKNFMKQGIPKAEAYQRGTLAARRYMDFGQGGAAVKALDSVLPYFNAAIQGHRAWMRGAKNDPVGFTSKILQVGGASAVLTTYNIVNNPEAFESIPDRIKTSNWIFTTPHYRVDEDGIKEYMYISIPKPPGISAGFSVFEATAEAAQGRDVPYKQILMGIDDFMGIGSVPPTLAAALAITGNVDSFTWKQIYKGGREIEKTAEITKNTPEWAIRAGEITGQSPERIRTAKSKFFTYRNGWYDASAATVDAIYSTMTDKEISETTEKMATLEGAPGARRFVRFTSGQVSKEKAGDLMREYNTRRKKQNMAMDKIFDDDKAKIMIDKSVTDYIDAQPEEDRPALRQRANNIRRHSDIPRHFININYITSSSPETKAKVMFDEWARADKDGKREIDSYVGRIIGMANARFLRVYEELKKQKKVEPN